MKRIIILSLLAMSALSACNTMAGLGDDTKQAGAKLEKSADDNK